ncbi:MAG: signal peptide peptidase SppA [Rhizobiaceae bacterium]|nr:signal peptide peptidase SppA [Hyphomicrobiales bacterium]NRB29243.1 signal peptide peptidase SppA [Rhizobiaceae bacterium]
MALDIDAILDRRRLRRKLTFWRIAALLVLSVAIVATLSASGLFDTLTKPGAHIARVSISGTIYEDRNLLRMLDKIKESDEVKGVILSMDSPGGTTAGGEAIYEAVRAISEKKPVVTSVKTLAASAGYMIAAGSDHIIARRTSIVGSIGVIFQYPQASELLDKIGVSIEEIKSSPLKAEPSPFHIPPPEAEVVIKELITDTYYWFVDLVAERRQMSRDDALLLSDGRVFSGDRGLKNKLVDALGGETAAKDWLVSEKGLDKDLKVNDWKPFDPNQSYLNLQAVKQWLFEGDASSLKGVNPENLPAIVPKRLFLDGLLSIWHK